MKRALVFFLALVVVAGVIVGVALSKTHTDKLVLPSREVDTFLHAWARNDPADMATLLDAAPPDLADQASSLVDAVPGSTATYTRTGIFSASSPSTSPSSGSAASTARVRRMASLERSARTSSGPALVA
jgi:hypothetical protein